MRTRDALGLTLAPLFLRLMLAITFLWAGLGKVMEQTTLPPEQAARLANVGGPKPTRSPINAPAPKLGDPTPLAPLPDPNRPATSLPPAPTVPTAPTTVPPASDPASGEGLGSPPKQTTEGDEIKEDPSRSSRPSMPVLAQVATQLGVQPEPGTDASAGATSPAPAGDTPGVASPKATPVYTAADFPEPIEVFKGMNIALLIDRAANPAPHVDGTTPMPLWPAQAAGSPWPVVFAWAAACTEILAGALLILGLFTRLSALSLAGTMVVAMWLTQIGPAIQQGGATFGFLPPHATFDIAAWQPLFWQFSLLASSLALFFLGSGPAGLDAAIFGGPAERSPRPARRKALADD